MKETIEKELNAAFNCARVFPSVLRCRGLELGNKILSLEADFPPQTFTQSMGLGSFQGGQKNLLHYAAFMRIVLPIIGLICIRIDSSCLICVPT